VALSIVFQSSRISSSRTRSILSTIVYSIYSLRFNLKVIYGFNTWIKKHTNQSMQWLFKILGDIEKIKYLEKQSDSQIDLFIYFVCKTTFILKRKEYQLTWIDCSDRTNVMQLNAGITWSESSFPHANIQYLLLLGSLYLGVHRHNLNTCIGYGSRIVTIWSHFYESE
jgi:hypothetical protein